MSDYIIGTSGLNSCGVLRIYGNAGVDTPVELWEDDFEDFYETYLYTDKQKVVMFKVDEDFLYEAMNREKFLIMGLTKDKVDLSEFGSMFQETGPLFYSTDSYLGVSTFPPGPNKIKKLRYEDVVSSADFSLYSQINSSGKDYCSLRLNLPIDKTSLVLLNDTGRKAYGATLADLGFEGVLSFKNTYQGNHIYQRKPTCSQ